MEVKSKPGTKCPMEGRPRKYITDDKAVAVPDTAYYKRLVRDGSLIAARAGSKAAKDKPTQAKEA